MPFRKTFVKLCAWTENTGRKSFIYNYLHVINEHAKIFIGKILFFSALSSFVLHFYVYFENDTIPTASVKMAITVKMMHFKAQHCHSTSDGAVTLRGVISV